MTQNTGYLKVTGNLVLNNGTRIPGDLYYSGEEFKGFRPHEHDYHLGLLFKGIYKSDDPSFKGLNALFPGGWIDEPDSPLIFSASDNTSPQIHGMETGGRTMHKAKILIVENRDDAKGILHDYLTANDYLVLEAETGEEAYAMAVQHMPDVILIDVALPAQSGVDLCQQLKTCDFLRAIPVIMLTGMEEMNQNAQDDVGGARQWMPGHSRLDHVEMCIHRALRRNHKQTKRTECFRQGLSSKGQLSFVFEDPASAHHNSQADE